MLKEEEKMIKDFFGNLKGNLEKINWEDNIKSVKELGEQLNFVDSAYNKGVEDVATLISEIDPTNEALINAIKALKK